MNKQEGTGWAIIMIVIFILLWLWKNWLTVFGGGSQTAVVQSGIALPGGQQNMPTTTTYPTSGGCCG